MRVSALIVFSALAALLAGGCAPYRYADDHRDELHRQDQYDRAERSRSAERPRRVAAAPPKPPTQRQRTAVVAKPKPAAYAAPRQAVASPASVERQRPEYVAEPAATRPIAKAPPVAAPAAVEPPAATVAKPPPVATAAIPAQPDQPRATAPVDAPGSSTSSPEARKEIADGYRLLRAGFVKKARERFAAAMPTATADATLAEARSMDPSYLASVAFPDVEPDAEQARRLYRRALMLGAGEAKSDLERLESASANAARNTPSAE